VFCRFGSDSRTSNDPRTSMARTHGGCCTHTRPSHGTSTDGCSPHAPGTYAPIPADADLWNGRKSVHGAVYASHEHERLLWAATGGKLPPNAPSATPHNASTCSPPSDDEQWRYAAVWRHAIYERQWCRDAASSWGDHLRGTPCVGCTRADENKRVRSPAPEEQKDPSSGVLRESG
jgi:hypothetical protein